jgi:hypothetical protein
MSFSITNFVIIKMKKIGIIADESSETRAKVIIYSGLKDQSMLLIFAREDTKYIPNIHNNRRIKKIIYHLLTNFVQKFTFLK